MRWLGRYACNAAVLLAADGVVLLAALLIGDVAMWRLAGTPVSLKYSLLVIPVWWIGALWAGLAPGWGLNAVAEIRRLEIWLALLFAAAGVVVFVSDMSGAASRGSYFIAYLAAAAALPLSRQAARHWAASRPWWGVPAVVYGGGDLGRRAVEALRAEPTLGYRPVGVFSPEPLAGLPRLGGLMDSHGSTDVAFLADDRLDADELTALLDGPLSRYRTVVLMPGLLDTPSLWVRPGDYHGLIGLEITNNLLDLRARLLKRAWDLLLVLALAPLWVPVGVVVAVALLVSDRRPIFFGQVRVGRGGRCFRMWKFRTMVPDAEAQLRERLERDPVLRAEWSARHKLHNDWRVTPLGRWLRRRSLDEIPQLWNVLRGEMALVGPRPLPEEHHANLPSAARAVRERVLPGVTGLWQIYGRGEPDADALARWDGYYVRNWSIWLDVLILSRTLWAVLRGRGAQ